MASTTTTSSQSARRTTVQAIADSLQTTSDTPEEDLLQRQVLLAFLALTKYRAFWAGHILLLSSLGALEMQFALAGLIAGALVLAIGGEVEAQRKALRSGAYDFLVNDLDEAVRILKNEARRGSPVAIGLEGDPAAYLVSVRNRGIVPALVVQSSQASPLAFPESAAWTVQSPDSLDRSATIDLSHIHRYTFKDIRSREHFDQTVRTRLAPENLALQRWISAAPRALPRFRSAQRLLYLSPEEAARLNQT